VLQRNPHPYPLVVPDIPAEVQPGATVEWPTPIAGFEPVPGPAPAVEATPKKKTAAPTPAASSEESAP